MKIKISIEKEGKKNAKEISLGLKSIVKKTTDSVAKVAKKFENQMDSGELFENAGNHVENAIDKVDEFTQKAQEHVEQVIGEADNIAKKAERYAKHVSNLAKETAEYAKNTFSEKKNEANESMQEPGDDDAYPNEVDEEEIAKLALKNKISQIPEGKIFTLSEYLDYTEEGNCIKDTSAFDYRSEIFLDTIKFPWSPEALDAFSYVANLKKPSYEVLSKQLSAKYSRDIVMELKKDFKTWLKGRPDVKNYCPKANLWHLLLYYRKKVNEVINK